ncbi:uncharacterized protein SPAPADRAFT_62665 [Spathaspora passalidarum NRRL Y-27907]|uniref:Uncharacterized protein n=1 Tax=Spathaspora passalidarum (strain NRRL Y-27907 / 11-Y1) TaxID=619300 RepID=G3AT32_SPAPN|nr:uncharacterized protein SPAPADRAFT_62665 [Spathaspora passalidarum NRRL Y-27907]EGW30795.1 hypothetical protein SPAPADRAFT_62665 [Spathaspora passalidarum NRRL Y-27907]
MIFQQYLLFCFYLTAISGAALVADSEHADVGPQDLASSVTRYDPVSAISPLPVASSTSAIPTTESTDSSGKAVSSASISIYSQTIILCCLISTCMVL